jgi:hypothetical protein
MLLELKRWVIPPGHQALLTDVFWSELEEILEELGEQRSRRISYSNGIVEMMTPLSEHEDIDAQPNTLPFLSLLVFNHYVIVTSENSDYLAISGYIKRFARFCQRNYLLILIKSS